jgi:hypothetical protein
VDSYLLILSSQLISAKDPTLHESMMENDMIHYSIYALSIPGRYSNLLIKLSSLQRNFREVAGDMNHRRFECFSFLTRFLYDKVGQVPS